MRRLSLMILFLAFAFFPQPSSWSGDTVSPDQREGRNTAKNHRCPDGGGFSQTVFIIPRVYITYIGKSDCWSEIQEVEIPVDFLKLQDAAREEGDTHAYKIMSHLTLPEFFTRLLESGRYAMPGDALSAILGYVQRNDYKGLYRLYRSTGKSE